MALNVKRFKQRLRRNFYKKLTVLVLLLSAYSVYQLVNYTVNMHKMVVVCDFVMEQHFKADDFTSKRNGPAKVDVMKEKDMHFSTESIQNMTSKEINTALSSIDLVNDYYPFIDFQFVLPEIWPKVDKTPKIFIIVLVNSGAKGEKFRKSREAIRETWGNQSNCEQRKALKDKSLKDLRWVLVFIVGKAGPETKDDQLNMAEARKYNDMLIGNITDNYLNNIVKLYMGLVWASRFDTKYVLKTDDDVYVRVPRVLEYLVKAKFRRPFYGGSVVLRSPVQRKIGDKWAISYKYYEKACYPTYHAGAFFILSSDLLNILFNYVYKRMPFHVDDAYVGLAMYDFGVNITKIPSFIIKDKATMFLRKAKDCMISPLVAFGHNVDPRLSRQFHGRINKLACEQGYTPAPCAKKRQKKKNATSAVLGVLGTLLHIYEHFV